MQNRLRFAPILAAIAFAITACPEDTTDVCADKTCDATTPTCVDLNGEAVCQCTATSCGAGKVCDATTKTCKDEADVCAAKGCAGETPVCVVASGAAVCQCNDTSCGAGKKCDATSKACVAQDPLCQAKGCAGETPDCAVVSGAAVCQCTATSCGAGKKCDAALKACVSDNPLCDAKGCAGETPACIVENGAAVCQCTATSCPTGKKCDATSKACVADPCATATCTGEKPTCVEKNGAAVCVCNATSCPSGKSCDQGAGACIDGDPCATKTCTGATPTCAVVNGAAVCQCTETSCGAGKKCDAAKTACIDDPCAACTGATPVCVNDKCECNATSCGAGKLCSAGACKADPCFGKTCAAGESCDSGDGRCKCTATPNSCTTAPNTVCSVSGSCVPEGSPCATKVCDATTPECSVDGTDAVCKCTATSCGAGKKCVAGACESAIDIETCSTNLPTPPNGQTCDTVAGTNGKVLLTGDVLVPGKILRGGQVLVNEQGTIECVGCDCSATATGAIKITCPNAVVSPGLINTHDHISYADSQPTPPTAERFEHRHDWRRGNDGHTNLQSKYSINGGATSDTVSYAELRFVMGGATTTNGSGGANGLLRNVDQTGTRSEGLGARQVIYDTFPLGDSGGTETTSGCGYNYTFDATQAKGKNWTDLDSYCPHVGEGINLAAQNEFVCVGTATHSLMNSKTSFIHGIAAKPGDVQKMAAGGAKLIWSPRSNISLYGDTAIVPMYARMGVLVALGTDWLASGSMNMLRELRCAADLNDTFFNKYLTDEQLWMLTTSNAAQALGIDSKVGTLKAGLAADIAVFAKGGRADHRAVIEAQPQDVALVLRGGKVLYGDANVVTALPDSGACDALAVCSVNKKACVSRETGKTLAALTSVEESKYPLFFCNNQTPTKEPSCQPQRTCTATGANCPVLASVDGASVYTGVPAADDKDGDGFKDAVDNCPDVFNPIRPMDGGKQADADNDQVGDACDPCPLDANSTTCKVYDPNDKDGDTIANASDNCPDNANTDQADGDSDQKGDVCDKCPSIPNPGANACPGTIYQVRDGTIAKGDTVAISNVLVTGVGTRGFFVGHKPGDADYKGADDSGVLVYTGTAPTVKVGDRVDLTTATTDVFYLEFQLKSATVVVKSSTGEAMPATVVAPAEIATGGARAAKLEGVLVKVENVTVTNPEPTIDPNDKTAPWEFEVTGGLRVHDFLFTQTAKPAAGEVYTSITGLLHLDFNNMKVEPRDAADLVKVPPTPKLIGIEPATGASITVGASNATTYPTPVAVKLEKALPTDTEVEVTSASADLEVVGSKVVVPAGQTTANVLFNGKTANAGVVVTAKLGADTFTSTVAVVQAVAPTALTLTPATATVAPNGTVALKVAIDKPAPAAGFEVTLAATGGTAPATVTIAANTDNATFNFVAGATLGAAKVTATAGSLTAESNLTIAVPQPTALTIAPSSVTVAPSGTANMIVSVDVPVSGAALTVALASTRAGAVPATVEIAIGATAANFVYTADAAVGTDTITATAGSLTQATATVTIAAATACEPKVVISQIFGGGGNTGAPFKNDFIELHNRSGAAVDLTGWSVQYSSSSGTTWTVTELTGSIPANGYFLIAEAAGTGTAPALPTPEVTGTITMSGTTGKVALVNTKTALTGANPTSAAIVDLVGFGSATFFEGAVAPAPSNSTSIIRAGDGCTDTNNNGSDFTAVAPNPRNSASPAAAACVCQ